MHNKKGLLLSDYNESRHSFHLLLKDIEPLENILNDENFKYKNENEFCFYFGINNKNNILADHLLF